MGGTDTFVDAGGTDEIIESFGRRLRPLRQPARDRHGDRLRHGRRPQRHRLHRRDRRGHLGVREGDAVRHAALHAVRPKPFVGGESNVFAVGSATGTLSINGVNRTGITPWRGTAILSGRDFNDTYIVETPGLRGGTVAARRGHRRHPGNDTLLIHGSDAERDEPDRRRRRRCATPITPRRIASTQISVDDGGATPATIIASQNIENATLQLRGGNDTLAVRSLNMPLTVDLGDGNDTVLAGTKAFELTGFNSGGVLDGCSHRLVLIGGNGTDTLRADDSADTDNNTGTLTPTLLTGLDTQGIDYTGFEIFALDLGSGNDNLTVSSTISGPSAITTGAGNDTVTIRTLGGATTLDTGAGADTVSVGSLAGLLDGIASTLAITGGSESDALTLTDSGDSKDNTGHLTSTTVTGLGLGGTLTYTGFEALTLTAWARATTRCSSTPRTRARR